MSENIETTEPVAVEQPDLPNPIPAQGFEPAPRPKRRIGSGALFGTALVLGVLGGVGTGYAVQASRPATPLPPLTATQPKYLPVGVYQGIAPAMPSSSQDDATLTDGDLTKLLLPVPKGASTEDSGWLDQSIDIEENAALYNDPVQNFTSNFTDGVEAIADTSWTQNGYYVEIRVFRFAPGRSSTTRDWLTSYSGDSLPMPSGIDAAGSESLDSDHDNDDNAIAVHGNLAVYFWVTSPSKVPDPSVIDKVISEQMGRL